MSPLATRIGGNAASATESKHFRGNNFMKNLAVAGAALALAGLEEPWPGSVPALKASPIKRAKRLLRDVAAQ